MSETNAINMNGEDKNPERRTNSRDQDNKDFPSFIMAVVALICIYMLAGFTVFKYTAVIALVTKFVEIINSNSTTNNNQINTSSLSQISTNHSNEARDDIISDLPATTIHHSTTINMKESKAEDARDDQDTEISTTDLEQQRSNDDHSNVLANNIAQLPDSDVNRISNLIIREDTVAVLITQTDDNSINVSSTVQQQDTAVPTIPPTTLTTAEPIVQRSAFVTENVMKIAVSYSGKERRRVLKITRILQSRMKTPECPHPVFIDQDFQHEICRLNGLSHLLSIYRQAQLVIVFLSPTYTDSRYCSGEWRTIAQRFLSNRKNKEATQVLLIKLGEYEMEQLDLVDSDFSVNGMRMSNEEIADIILSRWEIVEKNLKRSGQ